MHSFIKHKRWVVTAIAAIGVLMLAGGAVGNIQPLPPTPALALDGCGYTQTISGFPRASDSFNEQGNIATGSIVATNDGRVIAFASDETGILAGIADSESVDTDSNSNGPPTVPSSTMDKAITQTAPEVGDLDMVDAAANGGRPFFPALFLTDLGTGVVAASQASVPQAGDWQENGGSNGNAGKNVPARITGMWATGTMNADTETGTVLPTLASPKNPGSVNGKAISSYPSNTWASITGYTGDTQPSGATTEAYKDELQWNSHTTAVASTIGSTPGQSLVAWDPVTSTVGPVEAGHTYKAQILQHDGDHGSDQMEACTILTLPGGTVQSHPGGTDSNSGGTGHTTYGTGGTALLAINNRFEDSAVITGNEGTATGSVVFTLYGPSATPNCGTAIYTSNAIPLDANGTARTTDSANASNPPPTATGLGDYYWIATFTGSLKYSGFTSSDTCGNETTTVVDGRVRLTPLTATNIIGQAHEFDGIVEISTDDTNWSSPTTDGTVSGSIAMCLGSASPPTGCPAASTNSAGATFVGDGTSQTCTLDTTPPTPAVANECGESIVANQAGSAQLHGVSTFTVTANNNVTPALPGIIGTFSDSTGPSAGNCASPTTAANCTNDGVKTWINPTTTLLVQDETTCGSGVNCPAGTYEFKAFSDSSCSTQVAQSNSISFSGSGSTVGPTTDWSTSNSSQTSGALQVPAGTTVYLQTFLNGTALGTCNTTNPAKESASSSS